MAGIDNVATITKTHLTDKKTTILHCQAVSMAVSGIFSAWLT